MSAEAPTLFTLEEAAMRLHKSARWLRVFLRGRPIGLMIGRSRLFKEIDIEKLRLAVLHEAMDRLGSNTEAKKTQGHIYFIESGDFVKIGYTRSPVSRVRRMLTDSPVEPKILHAEYGTFKQEKIYHRHFAAIRVRGEWFKKTPELLAFIEQRKQIAAGEA